MSARAALDTWLSPPVLILTVSAFLVFVDRHDRSHSHPPNTLISCLPACPVLCWTLGVPLCGRSEAPLWSYIMKGIQTE